MSELKTIVTQETKDLIDAAVERARTAASSATTSANVAETKAAEARASYEAILAEENNYKPLLSKTSLTEEEFLKIVNAGGQAEMKTGVEVTLPNAKGTTDVWVVADVNHDGTTGTVDLIAKNLIQNSTANAYTTNGGKWGSSQVYKDSTIRSWLTGTYITGFSTAIQNALKTMDVVTNGSGTVQDKIKLLSMNEVGFSNSDYQYVPSTVEGTMYPIFESGDGTSARSKRKKYKADGTANWYWTRTRGAGTLGIVCVVNLYGSYSYSGDTFTDGGIVPAIRF